MRILLFVLDGPKRKNERDCDDDDVDTRNESDGIRPEKDVTRYWNQREQADQNGGARGDDRGEDRHHIPKL